ncbi:MAG: RloB family protein [Xanthobacteraceae bacterium]
MIFSEGSRTEPDYIRDFVRDHGNSLVKVELGPHGVPTSLVEAAVTYLNRSRRRRRDSFEKRDQVWVVFDCDDHPNLRAAIARARDNGVNVAYSNPCFELWALLHLEDHDAPISRQHLQRRLANLMPGYDAQRSKRIDYELIRTAYNEADERAERMARRRVEEGDAMGNPYTDVYELTRRIKENGKK